MGFFSKKKEPEVQVAGKQVTTALVIPLKELHTFDSDEFAKIYRREWGGKVSIQEVRDQALGVKKYILSEEHEKLVLTVNNNPIPANLVELAVTMARSSAMPNQLDDIEAKELQRNIGGISIESTVNQSNARVHCAFATQTLLAILKHNESATGCNFISGQIYRSRGWIQRMAADHEIDPSLMFVLLGNMHAVLDRECWVHTHGMEQFGAPDIEIYFDDEKQIPYYTEMVGNAAMYVAAQGPVLKIGDTSEMGGDGVIYRIVEARSDSDHDYGAFGAIRLARTA
jgi:hypothetical protein